MTFIRVMVFWCFPTIAGIFLAAHWESLISLLGDTSSVPEEIWSKSAYIGAFLLIMSLGAMQSSFVSSTSWKFQIPYMLSCMLGLFSAIGKPNEFTVTVESTVALQTIIAIVWKNN